MESKYLNFVGNQVHYLRFGNGPALLFALHGYGDRARMFAVLEEALKDDYTVIALDLPFHGQTTWKNTTFCKQDLVNIITQLAEAENQAHFSLMGFSFGARLAQAMLPDFGNRLNKLYLISPDGWNTRGMWMAVHTPQWVRAVLFKLLKRPKWFLQIVQAGTKIQVVPRLIAGFLASNLTRPDRFSRTFGCWFALNSFYLKRRRIRAIISDTSLPVDVYFGKKDEMIRFKTVRKMAQKSPNLRLFMLEGGHRLISDQLRDKMLEVKNT